jgi:hypothetical protein
MTLSTTVVDERRSWISALVILLLVSLWMLTMRFMNSAFLMLDFEVSIVYFPTVLAALVVLHLSLRSPSEPVSPTG